MQVKTHNFFSTGVLLFTLLGLAWLFSLQSAWCASASSYTNQGQAFVPHEAAWRIRIHEAAVVQGDMVTLGDIGEVFGTYPEHVWAELAKRPLWPAPVELGKVFIINRARLSKALRQSMGDYTDIFILPSQLAIQRGGDVVREAALQGLVVRSLTPFIHALEGQGELLEFRLPAYIFLEHAGQQISLEPVKLEPGRLSLAFFVREVDGSDVRRFTGTAMLHVWQDVPTPTRPLSRGDALNVSQITRIRQNLAYTKGEIWDGRGGPWQVRRNISPGQVILATDIEPLAMIARGDIVSLEYRRGSIFVKVQAEALADGGLGETIPVRNLQSKKQVYARVLDSGRVEVQ